jgi:two-component system OmpR family sensor kinase
LGLVVSGVVTYKSLESFLVTRLDQQLENSPHQAARALNSCVPQPGSNTCHSGDLPSVPTGTFGQLRIPGGSTISGWFLSSSTEPEPNLPANLQVSSAQNPTIFTVSSSSGVTYNAVAEEVEVEVQVVGPLAQTEPVAAVVVVAVPLTDVDQTLNRLLLVELFVSAAVLIVLGALAWWIVRAGLRPLDEMTETAGAIAQGDLSRRVPPGDESTEVGRLGHALNVMLGEIEESFAARKASEERLRRFLADASHELRTPLTSIRGYAEMFDRGARDRPDDLATSMHHIRADADRMSGLVEDLLVLARLDRERPLAHELVDLREVAQPAVAAIALQEPERNITLEADGPLLVVGDSGRLRQVVDNLLVNAVRHTPAGTAISVELSEQAGSAVISVLDRGSGIPPEDRLRIFEPFYRSDPSRSRATGGQGLGLAIVSTIVQAHGGQVGVSPGEDGGARFWVRIPLAAALVEDEADEVAKTEHAGDGLAGDPSAGDRVQDVRGPASRANGRVPVVAPTSQVGTSHLGKPEPRP